ncbi:helix-turn-helix transcriptional regulator [Sphaerotilaceae bacterium SBD11-9]
MISALGIEVKARRTELELTQEDLAGRMAIDRPFVSLIEVGRKQPTISVLYSLATALELTFEQLAARVEARYLTASKAHSKRKSPSRA